ncbi:hypothetical protein BDZ94DRAFT_1313768 [Collybia nuda]|uniref:DUF6533 domain-containing protein n=1 Tax=Collybia nuda TaxID=64659 RepID=A0A9P5XW41_9AGAR|nr:hypothetical protein BDZ94DRAFT_1313768 [Collybia nuda]
MNISSDIPLLNPFTPMAFLTPEQAYQKTITDYIVVGGLSVLIWDILTHLPSDYKLVTQHRINVPTITYLISRWSTLLYAITGTVYHTAPIGDCDTLTKVTCAVYHVTVSSTALLFFFRVRAIFNRNVYITAGFFVLWVIVLGGSLSTVLSISGVHIGNTKYCAYTNFRSYRSGVANITLAVFDTCVFVAITWSLSHSQLSIQKNGGLSSETHFDVFGRYLPAFSKALLIDGQKYYMVATIANLLVVIFDFAPGIPMAYRATSLAPAIGLTNIMACRVFRHTKMGRAGQDAHATSVSTMVFRKGNNEPTPPLFIHTQMQRGSTTTTMASVTESEFYVSSATEKDTTSFSSHSFEKAESVSGEMVSVHQMV